MLRSYVSQRTRWAIPQPPVFHSMEVRNSKDKAKEGINAAGEAVQKAYEKAKK